MIVEFDSISHRIRRKLASFARGRAKGFAHKHKGHWFLLYEHDNQLVLFYDGANFPVDDITINVTTKSASSSVVEISSKGRLIFSDCVSLSAVADFPSTTDERRQENFFFWLKSLAEDERFRGDMIRLWSNDVSSSKGSRLTS